MGIALPEEVVQDLRDLEEQLEKERRLLCKALCPLCAQDSRPFKQLGSGWAHFVHPLLGPEKPCRASEVWDRISG